MKVFDICNQRVQKAVKEVNASILQSELNGFVANADLILKGSTQFSFDITGGNACITQLEVSLVEEDPIAKMLKAEITNVLPDNVVNAFISYWLDKASTGNEDLGALLQRVAQYVKAEGGG